MTEGSRDQTQLELSRARARYIISAALVWVAILFASSAILAGTSYLAPMIPILGGGAVWFVLIAPAAFHRVR